MSVDSPDSGTVREVVAPPPPVVPLIRNRDFQALWTSESAAALAKEAAEIAYPLLILATTGSALYAGAVGSVSLLIASLTSIPGGALVDRIDRRRLLLFCDLGRLFFLALFGLLVIAGHAHLLVIFAIVAGSAVCLGISNPAGLAAIKQLVPPSQMTSAISQNQIRFFGATVVGPPIGAALYAVSRSFPFLAAALAFGIAGFLLLLIKKPMQAASTLTERRGKGAIEGIRFIARRPILLFFLIWIMGSNMVFNHTAVFLSIVATAHSRGASSTLTGFTVAAAGAGGLIGSFIAAPVLKRIPPTVIILWAAWVGPVAAYLMASLHDVLPLGFIVACVFLRGPITSALFLAYVAAMAPDKLQGRVLGAVFFLTMIVQPVGLIGVGSIFDSVGPHWVFFTMGTVGVLAALPLTFSRQMRHLPTPETVALELEEEPAT